MTMTEARDTAALRCHHEVETELIDRTAASDDPRHAPGDMDSMWFHRILDPTQHHRNKETHGPNGCIEEQLRLLTRHLAPDTVYLEIGAGDGRLARTVAGHVRYAIGLEASDVLSATDERITNFSVLISDGISIPVPSRFVDVVFSPMLVEQRHPDDFEAHLREVARVLVPGGVYVCRAPQDLSPCADRGARECRIVELAARFRTAGFVSVHLEILVKGYPFPCPGWLYRLAGAAIGCVPRSVRTRLRRSVMFRHLFRTITVVARTPCCGGAILG